MRNSRETEKMAIKDDKISDEVQNSFNIMSLIPPPPIDSQWSTKFIELMGRLQTLLLQKIPEINLSNLSETKAEILKAADFFSKSHCDEIPKVFLPLLAKLADGSPLTLSQLTEKMHSMLFPGKCLTADILAAPTENCPVSMLTVRGALLKVVKRSNLGPKKFEIFLKKFF